MFQNVPVSGCLLDTEFMSISGHILDVQFCPEFLLKKFKWLCHHLYNVTYFKLYIIDSIFVRSSSLLNISRKVLNVSFALFTFFYKINLSIFRNIFSCPENVQFDLSGMRPEFFHVQNMSGLHVQIPDMKKFWISYLIIFLDIFRTYSNISGQIPDISMTFSWHSFFIGRPSRTELNRPHRIVHRPYRLESNWTELTGFLL